MRLGTPRDFSGGTLSKSAAAPTLTVLVSYLGKVRAAKRNAALIFTVIRRERADGGHFF